MKKQIEFDFSKWGQEGITVNSGESQMITLHQNPNHPTYYYGLDLSSNACSYHKSKLTMYQEVKPREIWVNEYKHKLGETCYSTIQGASKGSAVGCLRQVKFREVLDNEQ